MPPKKRHMSKVREETYREEELRRTLEEINRDARGGYREKRSRDSKPSADRGSKDDRRHKERTEESRSKGREEGSRHRDRDEARDERRRHRGEKDDHKRHREDGDDRRRNKEDGDDRRRRKDDGDDRRRHKVESDGDRRRHKNDDDDHRRSKDDGGDRRRSKDDGGDRRRSKDDGGDRRRHKDGADEKRYHRDDGDDRRRHREEGDEKRRHRGDKTDEKRQKEGREDDRRRHRDEKEEKSRHRNDKDDHRRHKTREETEEEREKRKREEKRKRREEEEGDDRRRRKAKEETEEEREKRKKEERRKRKEEEERKRREEEEKEKQRQEEMKRKMLEDKEEEDGYDDYEDDFENYDDDFENDDSSSGTVNEKNKEMADILRAMSAENNRLSRAKDNRQDSPSSSTSGEVVPTGRGTTSGQQKYFINFVSARTRQVDAEVANRTRQRSRELLRLIHLDCTTHDMFEMGELEAYQLYMRSCGRTAANQVACQTNDDAMEREVQCEPIERRTLWTLHPPDDLSAVGFATSDSERDEERRRSSMGGFGGLHDQLAKEEATRAMESESRQVLRSASLQQSLRVVLRLLEEESRPLIATAPDGACSQLSNGYSAVTCPPELRHLPCRFTAFSPTQTNLLLTLHSHATRGKTGPTDRDVGYALVWNVTVPQEPQEVLEAPTRATCAIFGPLSASLVFLGLVDGSVAVWDLREPAAWHPTDAKNRRRRAATYSTAVTHLETNHQAPVVDLRTLASTLGSFQLASLDTDGTVLLWVTTQLPSVDLAGSEADLGLRPGGRIRLSRTAELRSTRILGDFLSNAFAPSYETGAFLVGSELGEIHHVGRHGARLFPRVFRPSSNAAAAVVSLDLSPFQEPFFLAGYADGAVCIFHCHHAQPLLEFAQFGAEAGLVDVFWSRSRPAVFFALDGAGKLFTWDLTRDEHRPIHKEKPGGERKAVRMALSCDYSATRQGNRGRRPQAAFVFSGGGGDFLEVHEMSEALCVGDLDETFRVANLLNSFI